MVERINIPEYSVSEFNESVRNIIQSNFNYLRIKGEISEIKAATKGQIYLTLKDDRSVLSGVIWESNIKFLKFKPEAGIEVIVSGKITTWSRYKTTYQIDIDKLEIAGEGALLKLIEERKKRLQAKGIFDPKHKKEIPYLPNKIGVITSPTGAVIHDIINRIKNRFPVNIDIWSVPVQGADAAGSIIAAIKGFNNKTYLKKPDIIIIARGGGSPEDLMAFNDESLAMEVFVSNIPIISAIGHETDNTIIDFVSDLRASTPSAAAELSVPKKSELIQTIKHCSQQLNYIVQNNFTLCLEQLNNLTKFLKAPNYVINSFKDKFHFIFDSFIREMQSILQKKFSAVNILITRIQSPENNINIKRNEIKNLYVNLYRNINNKNNQKKHEVNKLIRLLNSNSLNTNLKKGYVIINKSQKIIKKSNQIKECDSIGIKFYDRSINVNIKKIN